LTLDSILHIAIFVHLCEAFLGVYPHFDLFKTLFFLNPCPNFKNVAIVGGANIELRPETVGRYISYTSHGQIGDWKAKWFYIDNHAPVLPNRVPGLPKRCHEWFNHGSIPVQEEELLQKIVVLKNKGVTGATVVFSWLGRQIQPLQKRCNAGFEYSSQEDPSRFSSEKIHPDEAMALLYSIFEGEDAVPEIPKLYRRNNPSKLVIL